MDKRGAEMKCKTCIVIFAFNRPEYLYVTLDSVFRSPDINKVDVLVYIDGGSDKLPEIMEVISNFDVRRIYINKHNLMILWGHVSALRDVFYKLDYDRCIYLEDDNLMRSDCLSFCRNHDPQEFIMSLSGKGNKSMHYRPRGNMITKCNFYDLDNWISSLTWIGLARPNRPDQILGFNTTSHDAVFYAFIQDTGNYSEFAGEYYTAHFGLVGVHSHDINSEINDLHSKMFAGDREHWLENIADIIHKGEYDTKFDSVLWLKKEFEYK